MWNRNFTMVVLGQVISLFGNGILRFALPLYLLNQTGSAGLFGLVTACAFIPMIILAPIGGIIADRMNKRNIMVVLDFSTAALVMVTQLLLGKMNLIALLLAVLVILYGIQGAYQPAVQASIPVLVKQDMIMQGNSVITLVGSLAGLLGPVIGGFIFSFYGLVPILQVSSICFLASAVMEIFIHIPFEKREAKGSIFAIGFGDLKDSFLYMKNDQPLIMVMSLVVAAINFFLSALMMIGLPVFITQMLKFDADTANRMYGYAEAILAAGSLLGGMGAGIFAKRFKPKNGYLTLLFDTLTLIPIGLAIMLPVPAMTAYIMIVCSTFVMMILASMFSVQIMSYLQMIVPGEYLGKIISCAMCIGMCAAPLGQAIYGGLFQLTGSRVYWVIFAATLITAVISLITKPVFVKLDELVTERLFPKNDKKIRQPRSCRNKLHKILPKSIT